MIECRFVEIEGQGRVPFVKKLLSYNIGKFEGVLEYDGYFYVDDDELPIRANLYTFTLQEPSPSFSRNAQIINHKKVEIYMREKFEDTSRCDDDGVCLFPTCKEKVYFRVLS